MSSLPSDDRFRFQVSAGRTWGWIQTQKNPSLTYHDYILGLRFYLLYPLSSNPQIPSDFVKADFLDTHLIWKFQDASSVLSSGGASSHPPRIIITRWWFQICFRFSPRFLRRWSNLTNMIQMGCWNHQLDHDVIRNPMDVPGHPAIQPNHLGMNSKPATGHRIHGMTLYLLIHEWSIFSMGGFSCR